VVFDFQEEFVFLIFLFFFIGVCNVLGILGVKSDSPCLEIKVFRIRNSNRKEVVFAAQTLIFNHEFMDFNVIHL